MPLPPPDSGAFGVIWTIGFYGMIAVLIAAILNSAYRSIAESNYNKSQPRLRVNARIINRRELLTGGGKTSVQTTYFCTFELPGDERIELTIPDEDFGLMVEGDRGVLEYQGRYYHSFSRDQGNAVQAT